MTSSQSPRLRSTSFVTLVVATVVIAALARHRLRQFPYPLDVAAAIRGAATTAAATVPAALAAWSIIGISLLAVARWLQRRRADLSTLEAALAAIVVLWAGAYLALLTLGPWGLFRTGVLRALTVALVVAAAWTARRRKTPIARVEATPLSGSLPQDGHTASAAPAERLRSRRGRQRRNAGAWIAVAAIALAIPPLLLMQIGSPVSPFMDVLPLVATVQKIVTFQFYNPFLNDATGLVALGRGSVGYEAPFALTALVAGIEAPLAMTALMVPVAALQLTALYFLGRTVHGGLAGGMATLFLLQTFTWRRTPDIRGTTIAFALVAIGIAFLCGKRRDGTRTALGALALGVAVTVNPLIGAVGMVVASLTILVSAVDLGTPLIVPVVALGAASIFALPQVAIGLSREVPLGLLPVVATTGFLMLAALAHTRDPRRYRRRAWPFARLAVIVGVPLAGLYLHAGRLSEFVGDDWLGHGTLALLAGLGFGVLAHAVWRRPARWPAATVPALALAVAVATHTVANPYRYAGHDLGTRSLASEVTTKMLFYWTPYWLALGAGVWFGMVARRWALGPALVLALALVIYPIRSTQQPQDYDGNPFSLAETWGFHLTFAARGYHNGRPDIRWVLDEGWRDVVPLVREEIAAGRITYDTHVLQISPSINSVELALGTGVSVDLVAPQGNDPGNIWLVGTRVRGLDSLPAAFAARPRYVLVEQSPPDRFPELAAYDEILVRPLFRFYRLRE